MTMDFGVPDTAYDSTDSCRGVKLLHDPVRNRYRVHRGRPDYPELAPAAV